MKLYEKKAMFLHQGVGKATLDGREYDLSTSVTSGAMIVKSKLTGRTYHIDWEDVIKLAIEAGVDCEPTPIVPVIPQQPDPGV